MNLAIVAEKMDEAVIRAKALEVGRAEGEVAVLRAKAAAKIKPALTAGQVEKLKNPPAPQFNDRLQGGVKRADRPAPPRDKNDLPMPPKPGEKPGE